MTPRARRILVTGGTGFVGGALVTQALARGDDVHLLVRPGTAPSRVPAGAVAHEVSLDDGASLRRCVDRVAPSHVLHLACDCGSAHGSTADLARDFLLADLAWLLTLFAALDAAERPPDALVLAGSLAEYGNGPQPATEAQRERPRSSYALAKTTATHLAQMLAPRRRYAVRIARLALVYGAGQRADFLIPQLVAQLLGGRPFTVRSPRHRRDLIHVDDAARGLLALADADVPTGAIVNLSSGIAHDMLTVAHLIVELTGSDPRLLRIDDRGGDGAPLVLGDPAAARGLLGWSASIGLREGLRRTIAATGQVRAAA